MMLRLLSLAVSGSRFIFLSIARLVSCFSCFSYRTPGNRLMIVFVMRWVFSTNDSVTVTVYWKFPANAVVCTHAVVYDHLYVFPSIMFLLLFFC